MMRAIVPRSVRAPSGDVETVAFDLAESPLAWLRTRRDKSGAAMIADDEFEAGERLRRDYTVGGLMARTTMNWEAFGSPTERRAGGAGGGLLVTEAAMAARERVQDAHEAVGPDFANLLVDVCCHLKGLSEVERHRAWPLRSGKVVLRLALAALSRHYGLSASARGRATAPIRRWGAADYRPKA